MNLKLLSILLGVSVITIFIPAAFAGIASIETICQERTTVECDEATSITNPGTLVQLKADFGIPPCIDPTDCEAIETVAQIFTVPLFPPPPVTVPPTPPITNGDMTFRALRDSGVFGYEFFACNLTSVFGEDAVADKEAWAVACLSDPNLLRIFVNAATFHDPTTGDTKTFSICASGCDVAPGDNLIFGIVPNNSVDNFLASPGDFYNDDGSPVLSPTSNRAPLFIFENANPGENDQVLGFLFTPLAPPDSKGLTLFTFEDLTRAAGVGPFPQSDEDFTDLGFGLDVALDESCPMPPFTSVEDCLCKKFKQLEFCPLGGEFLEIDSSALLLAGLQTSAIWILPIVLAGAGTGLGIAAFKLRRK